jgi:glycosyltransferase involved in cell wall biosynthesis
MLVLIFLLALLIEILVFVPLFWRFRKQIAILLVVLNGFLGGFAFVSRGNVIAVMVLFVVLYRMINLFRIIKGRMHKNYLYSSALRSTIWLGFAQLLTLSLLILLPLLEWSTYDFVFTGSLIQTVFLALLALLTLWNVYKTRHRPVSQFYSDKELPTLTVAIPARNETNDLTDCLHTILTNDYPKLEVIVYDDCSHDNISEVIKKFAHDGVRFIKGLPPDNRWLAKNYAYSRLAAEASGEIVLFCGVDVRFGRSALRSLVTTMLNRNKSMVSVMPKRHLSTPAAAFVQPMRYWWELVLPRRLFNRPQVLSTTWLIKKDVLSRLGGFEAVSRNILPEGYFAREAAKHDGYSFIRANNTLDVQTLKSLPRQRETAIRMRYPQVHRRPELIALLTLAHVFVLLSPFFITISSLLLGYQELFLLGSINIALMLCTHVLIVAISNPANVPTAMFNFPFVIITEIVLSNESMIKYEFSEVDWKGRNVCIPVMHVVPHLPKI